ncbi:MAG: hypothetical protein MJ209_06605 [archaeon]|nr:hypothetical protein [archaeon]
MKFKYFTGILIISFLVSSVGTAVVADVSSDDLNLAEMQNLDVDGNNNDGKLGLFGAALVHFQDRRTSDSIGSGYHVCVYNADNDKLVTECITGEDGTITVVTPSGSSGDFYAKIYRADGSLAYTVDFDISWCNNLIYLDIDV